MQLAADAAHRDRGFVRVLERVSCVGGKVFE